MAGPITVDTPDYQRGTVNAQVQLAAPGAHVPSVTVGVPPNAESLIVTNLVWSTHAIVQVRGVTTGALYPGVLLQPGPAGINTATWVFDIAAALDTEVEITVAPTPGFAWFVYADGGVHLTSDASALRSGLGQGYVVPSAPSPVAGDHPPVELQLGGALVTNGQNVLGAPGAGNRYRMFTAQAGQYSAPTTGALRNSGGGEFFMMESGNPGAFASWPLTGLALPDNSPVTAVINSAASVIVLVTYTVEAI